MVSQIFAQAERCSIFSADLGRGEPGSCSQFAITQAIEAAAWPRRQEQTGTMCESVKTNFRAGHCGT